MEPEALRFLAGKVKLGYYARDSEIVGPASGTVARLYILKQGAVRGRPDNVARSATGVDIVLGPGECFPLGALIGRRATAYSYRAQEDTFVYELEDADFRALLERSPKFQRFCTDYLAALVDQSHRVLRAQLGEALADEGRMRAPLRSLVHHAPVSCAPATTIREVLRTMHAQRIGSMIVVDGDGVPRGIFTHPDVLERVTLPGVALEEPISRVMTPHPVVLPDDAPVYEAAVAMAKHGIRHIILVADGRLTGVISERDLFSLQRASLRRAADRIRGAASVPALAEAAADIRLLARSLLVQGMGAEQLTEVVSALNDSLVRRLIDMIAARHALPRGWCWIALGSEGRMEQTLATDQDNALILEPGTAEAERKPFLAFADEVNRGLDACGFPLCKGDIMARNPKWCLPLEGWRAIFDGWIRNPEPKALLNAAIFFDLRALAGETQLAGQLRDGLLAQTAGNPAFLRAMASNALQVRPPIGLLRDFVTDDSKEFPNTLDLKMLGVRPYVDAARVWALAHRLAGTGTAERLRGAAKAGAMPEQEAADACAAFHFIQTLRLRHQHLEQPAPGGENRIDPDALNALDRRLLKETFRQTGKLQERLRLDYQL
jgi:CBS domain-containing protein